VRAERCRGQRDGDDEPSSEKRVPVSHERNLLGLGVDRTPRPILVTTLLARETKDALPEFTEAAPGERRLDRGFARTT
jgi:hypothetical protein